MGGWGVIRFYCRHKIKGLPLGSQCVISACPAIKTLSIVFIRPRNRSTFQTFCAIYSVHVPVLIWLASFVFSAALYKALWPRSLGVHERGPRAAVKGVRVAIERESMNKPGSECVSLREGNRERLFVKPELYCLVLGRMRYPFKLANQFSNLLWADDGSTP